MTKRWSVYRMDVLYVSGRPPRKTAWSSAGAQVNAYIIHMTEVTQADTVRLLAVAPCKS